MSDLAPLLTPQSPLPGHLYGTRAALFHLLRDAPDPARPARPPPPPPPPPRPPAPPPRRWPCLRRSSACCRRPPHPPARRSATFCTATVSIFAVLARAANRIGASSRARARKCNPKLRIYSVGSRKSRNSAAIGRIRDPDTVPHPSTVGRAVPKVIHKRRQTAQAGCCVSKISRKRQYSA